MPFSSTKAILEKVKSGQISVQKAERFLRLNALSIVDDIARLDINRHLRRGVPEIVYAEGKTPKQIQLILAKLLDRRKDSANDSPIIISKVSKDQLREIEETLKRFRSRRTQPIAGNLQYFESAKVVAVSFNQSKPNLSTQRARVGLLAAGTSDIPALDEAEAILSLMGCQTIRFNDVGIASLARLSDPLQKLQDFDPDVLIVAAGMEAALPSLIAGLSSVPIVGLPTSVGFGYGGGGEAALMSMLQGCPLGICVVNINGGVAAGIISWLIARRCAEARSGNKRRTALKEFEQN